MTLEPGPADPMTPDTLPTDSAPAAPPPGIGPSREYRATVTFAIGGAFILVVLLVVGGRVTSTPPIQGVVALAGVLLWIVAMFAAALGLGYRRPWAAAIATPMLWLLVLSGLVEVVMALTHSTLDFPIGAVLALWALRAPLRTPPDAATGRRSWGPAGAVVLAMMLLGTAWPVVSPILVTPGGPLVVDKSALLPSLAVACDGEPGQAPRTIHITYRWGWSRHELLAAGTDTVTLAAFSTGEDGQPTYVLGDTDPGSAGTYQSDIMIFQPIGEVFGIDLSEATFSPGMVGISLIPASDKPDAHGYILIQATYRHAPMDSGSAESPAQWRVTTEGQCQW